MSAVLLPMDYLNNVKPYNFKSTGVNVYSFEEALYYLYYNWREAADEYFEEDFILWVRDELNLSFISSEIRKLKARHDFSEKISEFFKLMYYFSENEILELKEELSKWEEQSLGEKLKKNADKLANYEKYGEALELYKKALEYMKDNGFIVNNMGICYMHKKMFEQAIDCFERAYLLNRNKDILYNLIEGYIAAGNLKQAEEFLNDARIYYNDSEIYYFLGEIELLNNSPAEALLNYKKAYKICPKKIYILKISDIYIRFGEYEAALSVLEELSESDTDMLLKKSEIYAEKEEYSHAARIMEKALFYDTENIRLWTKLALYHRLNGDFSMAEGAISKALTIDSLDKRANLEYAKLKKEQGKIKEYREALNKILKIFKDEYRNVYYA